MQCCLVPLEQSEQGPVGVVEGGDVGTQEDGHLVEVAADGAQGQKEAHPVSLLGPAITSR